MTSILSYAVKEMSEPNAKLITTVFGVAVSILLAIAGWYFKSTNTNIAVIAQSLNELTISQRELFVKLENFERHLSRSDQNMQALGQRINKLEIRIERHDEILKGGR